MRPSRALPANIKPHWWRQRAPLAAANKTRSHPMGWGRARASAPARPPAPAGGAARHPNANNAAPSCAGQARPLVLAAGGRHQDAHSPPPSCWPTHMLLAPARRCQHAKRPTRAPLVAPNVGQARSILVAIFASPLHLRRFCLSLVNFALYALLVRAAATLLPANILTIHLDGCPRCAHKSFAAATCLQARHFRPTTCLLAPPCVAGRGPATSRPMAPSLGARSNEARKHFPIVPTRWHPCGIHPGVDRILANF